jgi:hypothetical protein
MAGPVVVFRSQPVLNADLILLSAAGQQRLSKGTNDRYLLDAKSGSLLEAELKLGSTYSLMHMDNE